MQAVGFDGDVRKQEDAARVLAATVEHFGKLDILVNGAAGNFLASPEDLTPKGFRTGTSSKHALVCIQIRRSSLFQLFPHCRQYTESSFDQLCANLLDEQFCHQLVCSTSPIIYAVCSTSLIFSLQFSTLTLWVHTQCALKPSSI